MIHVQAWQHADRNLGHHGRDHDDVLSGIGPTPSHFKQQFSLGIAGLCIVHKHIARFNLITDFFCVSYVVAIPTAQANNLVSTILIGTGQGSSDTGRMSCDGNFHSNPRSCFCLRMYARLAGVPRFSTAKGSGCLRYA